MTGPVVDVGTLPGRHAGIGRLPLVDPADSAAAWDIRQDALDAARTRLARGLAARGQRGVGGQ